MIIRRSDGAALFSCGGRSGLGEAYLGEETFELAQTFADFDRVGGGEVVEREGEEGFHAGRDRGAFEERCLKEKRIVLELRASSL